MKFEEEFALQQKTIDWIFGMVPQNWGICVPFLMFSSHVQSRNY